VVKQFKGEVYLEPIKHEYIHKVTGKKYSSVTQLLSLIEHEFETELVADRIFRQSDDVKNEEYIGMTYNQIIDYWKMLNDSANEYGTFIHETIEKYLLKNKWYYPTDELEKKAIKGYEELNVDEGICVYPERIMFSDKYSLAGTADLKIDIDDKFFDIGDWKGLAVDTPIFTNNGWKTMGTIFYGDKVYDMNGNLCEILHFSRIKNESCFEIEFDNGEIIKSDHEHRWLISFMNNGKFIDKVMTTKELFDYKVKLNNRDKKYIHKTPNVRISKPLNNPSIKLPLDPYLLGVWLGNCNENEPKISNINKEIRVELGNRGYEFEIKKSNPEFNISKIFKELNLINNRRIPDVFLMASYEQRFDLLRGLMDTMGGYNQIYEKFSISTTVENKCIEIIKLITSLGIKTIVHKHKIINVGEIITIANIYFNTNNLNYFYLKMGLNYGYRTNNNHNFKTIINIKKIESVPTRCIEVNSPTHTFLYGYTFSVTHNTNKKFNFFNTFGNKPLKAPFNHLQQCHYSIYSLQLSVYAYMCEKETGMKCRQLWIGYWVRETERFIKIPIIYLKKEAKQLLEIHKYNTEISN